MKKILATFLFAAFIGTLVAAFAAPKPVAAENISWGELKCRYHPTNCKPTTTIPADDKNEG